MVHTLARAIDLAQSDQTNQHGMCLVQVQTWFGIPPAAPSASAAWKQARLKKKKDRHPPKGAPVFYLGGSSGFGHIAMSMGDGTIRSTDTPRATEISTVSLAWPEEHWGLRYAGWSADLENVEIPELVAVLHGEWTSGDVLVHKLHFGQEDSDSVRRLQHRLNGISLPAPGNITLPVSGNYLAKTDTVVRCWQGQLGQPVDAERQSQITAGQAALLFKSPPFTIRD